MFKKIKNWYYSKQKQAMPSVYAERELFTKSEMMEMYNKGLVIGQRLGYAEGKDDGIIIAKNATSNQLKELIWQQNKNRPQQSVHQVPLPPQ